MKNQTDKSHSADLSGIKDRKAVLREKFTRLRNQRFQEAKSVGFVWGWQQAARVVELIDVFNRINPLIRVLSYLPIRSEIDVNPVSFMGQMLFPRCVNEGELAWFDLSNAALPGQFGILEAPRNVCFDLKDWTQHLAMVIVPCLAVDNVGTRLGYGGGYYDRFLSKNKDRVITVSCVFEEFFVTELPKENHDVCVDIVCTESRTQVVNSSESFSKKISQSFFDQNFC